VLKLELMEKPLCSKEGRLISALGEEWYGVLKGEFDKWYMQRLSDSLVKRRTEVKVYPSQGEIFTAYKLTPYDKVRVCIIGQDPYINEGEAHGLAFSTSNGKYTPSLRQIEKAIRRDVSLPEGYIWANNLTRWAEQGVFLLNSVLTVDAGKSNSHLGIGWEDFTLQTVKRLDERGQVIFLLWGKYAHAYSSHISNSKVIKCEHPVAASYRGGVWDNADCFNRVNELIENKIIW
jgi:uracil-DNA glycosylase